VDPEDRRGESPTTGGPDFGVTHGQPRQSTMLTPTDSASKEASGTKQAGVAAANEDGHWREAALAVRSEIVVGRWARAWSAARPIESLSTKVERAGRMKPVSAISDTFTLSAAGPICDCVPAGTSCSRALSEVALDKG